jgi:hypothetical protein
VELERIEPAGQGLTVAAQLLVNAAPILEGEKPASTVRALSDPMKTGADGLEGVPRRSLAPVGRFSEPAPRLAPVVQLRFTRGNRDFPATATTVAALRACESLIGVEESIGHGG